MGHTHPRTPEHHSGGDPGHSLIFLIVFVGTGGEICLSRAMKTIGEVTDFRPHCGARVVGRAMRFRGCGLALPLMATGFFALLGDAVARQSQLCVSGHGAQLRRWRARAAGYFSESE